MQEELKTEHPDKTFHIVAVNLLGNTGWEEEFASSSLSLPMVQDNDLDLIWDTWGGEWRDVMILDDENNLSAQYNLTDYNLSDPTNYENLKVLFLEAHP
jgi:hypothetical protein